MMSGTVSHLSHLLLSLTVGAAEAGPVEPKVIEDFRKLSNWVQSPEIRVPSGEYGFEPAREGKAARMWYRGTPKRRSYYYWYAYRMTPRDVSRHDRIVIECKLGAGTRLTVDIWFDGKMVEPRPIGYAPGTGEWQEVSIPIRGPKLTCLCLSISNSDPGKDTTYEALFREIRAVADPRLGMDSSLPEVIVIPTPKRMEPLNQVVEISASGDARIDIALAAGASETVRIAAEELREDINRLASNERLATVVKDLAQANGEVVILMGERLEMAAAPGRSEGYAIRALRRQGKWRLYLSGHDDPGVYWAAKTLSQLMEMKEKSLSVTLCNIEDWPIYAVRGMGTYTSTEVAAQQFRYKVNNCHNPWWWVNWRDPGERYIRQTREIAEFAAKRGMNSEQDLCPYKSNPTIRCSSSEEIDKLFGLYRVGLEAGSRRILLSFDDPSRAKGSFRAEDAEYFGGNANKGYAHLLAELCKRVKGHYPGAVVACTPRDYQFVYQDFFKECEDAGVPKDVIFEWTGISTVTLHYRDEQLKAYKRNIGGRRFILFDNTPGQTYGMGRGIRMFAPYASGYGNLHKYCYGVHAMVAFGRDILCNLDAMTIAEYMWNADRYNADKAVARVLAHVAGREAVPHLLDYRHHYLRIATKFPIEKSLPNPEAKAQARNVLTEKERKRYCLTSDEYNLVKKDLAGLRVALEGSARTTANDALVSALEKEHDKVDRMLAYLRDSATEAPSFAPSGTVELDIDTFRGGTGFQIYEWKCPPRYAAWIYGKKTPYSSMRALFRLTAQPKGSAELIVHGQDDDKADVTQIEILVNDRSIFRGPNGFAKKGWSTKRFPLAPATLRAGGNVITVRNLEDSSAFAARWFMLSGCAIQFADRPDDVR